jgi:hypothetical protein
MSLICCPLQCGKFISSFQSHKNECPNKEKLGKFCQLCPYNKSHIISNNALMTHIHYCPNNPKNHIIEKPKEIKKNESEILPLKTGFPPLNITRPKFMKKKKEIENGKNYFDFYEKNSGLIYDIFKRNEDDLNMNFKRIVNNEEKLLSYYVNKN